MLAIFFYVGGEVTVGSAIVNFLGTERLGSVPKETASGYLAFYWGGLMIGRFMGAFALSDLRKPVKRLLVVLVPAAAWVVILLLPAIGRGSTRTGSRRPRCAVPPMPSITACSCCSSSSPFSSARPARSACSPCQRRHHRLLATGMLTTGTAAKWAILSIGLFCSVMWSNIFALAIEGLGPLKSQASSLLVLAILGGAILPPVQGAVADWRVSRRRSSCRCLPLPTSPSTASTAIAPDGRRRRSHRAGNGRALRRRRPTCVAWRTCNAQSGPRSTAALVVELAGRALRPLDGRLDLSGEGEFRSFLSPNKPFASGPAYGKRLPAF